MRTIQLLLAMLFLPIISFGQSANGPDHTYNLDGKIEYMKLTESGVLVVGGGGGVSGIKPGADRPQFVFSDYGKVKEENLEILPFTPYIIVTKDGGLGKILSQSERSVIDIVSGQKIFETNANGWKSVSQLKLFIPEKRLVVTGMRKGMLETDVSAGIYNLETGAEEKILALARAGANPETGTPFLVGNRLLVPTSGKVHCLDVSSGNELWTLPIKNLTSVEADESGNEIYGFQVKGNQTRIFKFSADGKELWGKEYKMKGVVNRFQILPQGLAVVSDSQPQGIGGGGLLGKVLDKATTGKSESKIAFIDAQTGQDLWENAPKTKGFVQHFYTLDDGILFGMANGGINKVSYNGQPLFKKPLKTGPNIHTLAISDQGIIYITEEDADIVNISTGESVWGKPIKYKKAKNVASAHDKNRNRYLLCTGKELLSIDANNGNVSTLSNISFSGNEQPTNIEVREGGILLTSSQNMQMLDFDGNELWNAYHRAPGKSAVGGILAGISGVTSAVLAASMSYSAGQQRAVRNFNTEESLMNTASGFEDIAMDSFIEMAKRFKATSASKNAQFILTSLDSGAGLVKVNKDTGEVEKEIHLNDKKPEYIIDEWGGFLYHQAGRTTLTSYNLK